MRCAAHLPRPTAAVLVLSVWAMAHADPPRTEWPIEPAASDHPISATFDYIDNSGTIAFHDGVDIHADAYLDRAYRADPTAPYVRVTVGGTITRKDLTPTSVGCWVDIDSGTAIYTYGHLACDQYHPSFPDRGQPVTAGTPIARIVDWGERCTSGYRHDHLHYRVKEAGVIYSAAATLAPLGAGEPPLLGYGKFRSNAAEPWVEDHDVIHLCKDQPSVADDTTVSWVCLDRVSPNSPTCVPTGGSGPLDAIVQIRSEHPVGQSGPLQGRMIAPRRVQYRICGEADPGCAWPDSQVLDLGVIETSWGPTEARAFYSRRRPFVSNDNYCCDETFWIVPTNVKAVSPRNKPDATGRWDPTSIADGHYTLAVRVEDHAGLSATATLPVCVNNGSCHPKLTVRDCASDDGSEPSPCDLGRNSPDIIVNGGTPDEGSVVVGSNHVRVCMTNVGCERFDPSDAVGVELDWIGATPAVPFTAPATPSPIPMTPVSSLHARDGTILSGPWSTQDERCLDTSLVVPAGGSTYGILVARVSAMRPGSPADHPVTTPSADLDNNRAQALLGSPPVSPFMAPGEDTIEVWLDACEIPCPRDLEVLVLPAEGAGAEPFRADLHLPPGVTFRSASAGLVGAAQVDARGSASVRWGALPERSDVEAWAVVGGIPIGAPIRVRGVHVARRAPLRLVLSTTSAGRRPLRLELVVRDLRDPESGGGTLAGQVRIPVVLGQVDR